MSALHTMEQIRVFAQVNDPSFLSLLPPSPFRPEIDALTASPPFSIAEEIYEIYQWHNGQKFGEYRGILASTNSYLCL